MVSKKICSLVLITLLFSGGDACAQSNANLQPMRQPGQFASRPQQDQPDVAAAPAAAKSAAAPAAKPAASPKAQPVKQPEPEPEADDEDEDEDRSVGFDDLSSTQRKTVEACAARQGVRLPSSMAELDKQANEGGHNARSPIPRSPTARAAFIQREIIYACMKRQGLSVPSKK